MIRQIRGEFKVKEPLPQRYYHTVSNLITWFKRVTMEYIHRIDALPQLAMAKKKSHHQSVVQICIRNPNIGEAKPMTRYLDLNIYKPEEEKAMRQ